MRMHPGRWVMSTKFLDFSTACRVSYYKLRITRKISLPLDRARRFTRDVVTNPVDAFNFVTDSIRNARKQFIGKPYPVGSHTVLAFDDAKNDRVFIGALVTHHTD